ncbi:MAG: hypothetical protein CM15mP115_11150 [Alphaproteobacteria bacterium]|nr:MAG: hypothetical protein CM15mP115_11150 [Alphaproteobacteria bacterium]
MGSDNRLREQICLLAKSMFDRGLTGGSTGNISARTEDGGLLVSPPAPASDGWTRRGWR